jgi:tRNA 2-selenouridine synthase
MQQNPLISLEDTLQNRIERILRDYVVNLCAEFVALHGEAEGFALFAEQLQKNLAAIVKRLGGERHRRFKAIMESALEEQLRCGNVDLHCGWIEGLLNEYYDPMYTYQRHQKADRVAFSGNQHEVTDYLKKRLANS